MWKRLTVRHGRELVRHILPAVMKPVQTLWNEVIGFMFLCFAVIFGFRTGHYALNWLRPPQGGDPSGEFGRMLIAGFCTLLTGWFALSSFLRARRISRS